MLTFLVTIVAICGVGSMAAAQHSVEANVVYGMYSGTALLMDVYVPATPNGYGLIHISGSGWHAPLGYDARPLKQSPHVDVYVKPLADAGFTVFTVNHRAAPRFRYPAAIEDAQRAMRYIRHHAERYGIRADRIGAIGGSSGGHLVSLLGLLDGSGQPDASDPVERESARVQCVVARAAPTVLARLEGTTGDGIPTSFMGSPVRFAQNLYDQASPISHVSGDDPPFLLLHGDADETIPLEQSHLLREALDRSGVAVKLIVVEGAGHGPSFPGAVEPPDLIPEIILWFRQHLINRDGA
jgi:acetyl esterase/lipase